MTEPRPDDICGNCRKTYAQHYIEDEAYCNLVTNGDVWTPIEIEQLVCDDIAARQRRGVAKYGTTVRDNPLPLREWLQHQYEELLDAAIYCRRAIAEIDRNIGGGK